MDEIAALEQAVAKINSEMSVMYTRLNDLSNERKSLRAKIREIRKVQRGPTPEQNAQTAIDLFKAGESVKDIAIKLNRTRGTVWVYINRFVNAETQQRLLSEGKASVQKPNKYGGETWHYDWSDYERIYKEIKRDLPLQGKAKP